MSHKSFSFFRVFMRKHTHHKRMGRVFAIAPCLSLFRQGLSRTLKLVFLLAGYQVLVTSPISASFPDPGKELRPDVATPSFLCEN